jgi:hypothetical protein
MKNAMAMKKYMICGAIACALMTACGDSVEKLAQKHLDAANELFAAGDYSGAKTEIDSIKILYPKAFKARHEGIRLLQQVELKEQERSLVYLDSVMTAKQEELKTIEPKFTLEKDSAYQQVGNYLWPTQVLEKNLHRTYLRFQVSEQALLSMTSVYCGGSNVHHTTVKVIAPDGTFAETPISNDVYETTDLSEKIEKAEFKIGADGDVMAFIYANNDKNLRVELGGDRSYAYAMTPADRIALKNVYELWQVLSAIEQVKKEQEEANLKIAFIHKRMEQQNEEK